MRIQDVQDAPGIQSNFFVDYRGQSKENLFLAGGWGMRDVRGPYIISAAGTIRIDGRLLSRSVESKLTLSLEASNRLAAAAILVTAICERRKKTIIIVRNQSVTIEFPATVRGPSEHFDLAIHVPESGAASAASLRDVVALNWLSISRRIG